ncbi:hypothetical protein [Actinomadura litoris]|uniref:hypothetical protein n=1 Tax=Actinomadura litoris TaxID=2678616 RepID=UPI001FA7685E|nr:hypothetical protein [Actinomadura litoris]
MIEITDENYPGMIAALTAFVSPLLTGVEQVDLGEMRAVCERLQALAPVAEPAAYRNGGDMNLADQGVFLKALEEFVTTLRTLDRRGEP